MRQRKVKNLEEKIFDNSRYFVENPGKLRGKWRDVFDNGNEIVLELGAGKGDFLIKQAEIRPDRNHIGIEGQLSVVLRALQKLEKSGLSNVRFASGFVWDPVELFAENEVAGIYLNFSDPWPKAAHSKRRLTHRNYLLSYHKILKPAGFIEIKTDSDGLFLFTESEAKDASDMFLTEETTEDLHSSEFRAKDIKSEYEVKFMEAGKAIHYMRLVKSAN